METPNVISNRFNWWILAFFLALLAFEVMREFYVLNKQEPLQLLSGTDFLSIDNQTGYATASGKWTQPAHDPDNWINKLGGSFSKIECSREKGVCTDSTAFVIPNDKMVFVTINTYDYPIESFDTERVVFGNTTECYTYKVSIDAIQKTTVAIKERIPLNTLSNCTETPERIVYELKEKTYESPTHKDTDAFLPIFRTIVYVIDLFSR